jgi:sugar phosphate isomerase/epimerase
MRIGCSSKLLWPEHIVSAIDFIGRQGYRAVEVWAEHMWRDGVETSVITRGLSVHELDVSVHAPAGKVNLAHPCAEARAHALKLNERAVELASSIGAGTVVVHPGRMVQSHQSREEVWSATKQSLAELCERARNLGVVVALENMENRVGEVLVAPADVLDMINEIGHRSAAMTLDIAHLATVGPDAPCLAQEITSIHHVHLSDHSRGHTHVPLGQGDLDVRWWLGFLEPRFSGLVIVEGLVSGSERETVSANREFLDRTLPTQDQLMGGV